MHYLPQPMQNKMVTNIIWKRICICFWIWVAYLSGWLFVSNIPNIFDLIFIFGIRLKQPLVPAFWFLFIQTILISCWMFNRNTQKMKYYTSHYLFVVCFNSMFHCCKLLLRDGDFFLKNISSELMPLLVGMLINDQIFHQCNNGWKYILYSFSNRIALTEILQKKN